ncbi:hypothetical protein ACFYWU_28905 [Streptomyces chrestomyceticus]|uniref:DUF7848 domain-containing protein n=1 Tax=Streptomyces chrestomyceticus TaxID=68185 RepID=UPI0036CD6977
MTSPGREHFSRLMRSHGHAGVLHLRTSEGSAAALDNPRSESPTMATPAPTPTRMEIQITGIREHVAECVTETEDKQCGVRSSAWDSPVQVNTWIRAHAEETGHTKYRKHMEEPVNTFSKPDRTPGR